MKSPSETRQTALNLLARREHSELELRRKLLNKGHDAQIITDTLVKLAQEGLLNTARFIESYVHTRRSKGYGPLRIQAELQARGITQDLIDQALDMSDNAWFSEATRLWQKRFKGDLPRDLKMRVKQMRFLQYRGFTPEQINSIYNSDDSL